MNGLLFIILFVVLMLKISAGEILVRRCPYNSTTEYHAYSGGKLPEYEVDAIKALLKNTNRTLEGQGKEFSVYECGVSNQVTCNCNCSTKICNIKTMSYHGYGLTGRIPEEIGNLSYLMRIDLNGNILREAIPKSFAKLSNLFSIDLSDNLLEGRIPPFLGNMTALIYIILSNNWFNGSVPEELSQLQSLKYLQLGANRLTGNIPHQLGNITNLEMLYLSDNQFSGLLPYQLGDLKNLESLLLGNNQLDGELPSSFINLSKLIRVNLRGNNFTGKVPDYIDKWQYLRILSLIGNKFQGPLPTAISLLKDLSYLLVSDLSNSSGGFSFPNLSRMTQLRSLTLRNCNITDGIPGYIVNMQYLSYLDLSFNRLTGEIPMVHPDSQPCLPSLKYIFLRGNKLNGSLPGWLMKSVPHSYVDVSENNFTGPVHVDVNSSKNFNTFECCFINTTLKKNLTEKWQANPYKCQKKTKYRDLYINCGGEKTTINGTEYKSDNKPNGGSTFVVSDDERWGYSSMGKFLNAYKDVYLANRTCNMSMDDSSLYETARLAPISLKYFGFCLENGNYTVKLHFAEIVWYQIRGLDSKARREFDVEIQGKKVLSNFNIEEAAGGVNKNITKVFPNTIVNNSRLEIHLFWTGKGSIFYPTVYYGPLISAISAFRVEKKHNRLSPLAIAGIVVASSLFPLLVLFLLWRGYFGVKDQEYEALKTKSPEKFFNFQQIKVATNNFSIKNKLGQGKYGPVYKGVLSDTAIAVKQFSTKSRQGINDFVNEFDTVFALQHQNLVKLLGCCAEHGQRVLIYEYMENNSLEHALFDSPKLKARLNWATRVRICRGIAKGLAFLHKESEPKLVHRDIKPKNILLDKDLTAKISDFGFTKHYEGGDSHFVTRVVGTIGYTAPEYVKFGRLNCKADVYSFGVVLLEIVSGKNSTINESDDQSDYLLEWACVKHKEGNLIELVDPALGNDYPRDEADTILNLAMRCIHQSNTLRPDMSEVVKILEEVN